MVQEAIGMGFVTYFKGCNSLHMIGFKLAHIAEGVAYSGLERKFLKEGSEALLGDKLKRIDFGCVQNNNYIRFVLYGYGRDKQTFKLLAKIRDGHYLFVLLAYFNEAGKVTVVNVPANILEGAFTVWPLKICWNIAEGRVASLYIRLNLDW